MNIIVFHRQYENIEEKCFSSNRHTWPIRSSSRDVRLYVSRPLPMRFFSRPLIGQPSFPNLLPYF